MLRSLCLALVAAWVSGAALGDAGLPELGPDANWQWRITFTPDGQVAYYAVSEGWFPRTRSATIVRSVCDADGHWGAPVTAAFSDQHSDMDPFISPDGNRLYFSSSRPAHPGTSIAPHRPKAAALPRVNWSKG